jgi:hypothetical protein
MNDVVEPINYRRALMTLRSESTNDINNDKF